MIDILNRFLVSFDEIHHAPIHELIERCKEARVVLLGEATHGTSEFYQMRAKISQELLSHHGFTLLAMEGDWPDFEEIDRFVRGEAIRKSLFQRFPTWLWKNEEFFRFLSWVQQMNGQRIEKIRLYGLDLYSIAGSIDSALLGANIKDAAFAAWAEELLKDLRACSREPSHYYYALKQGRCPSFQERVQAVWEEAQRRFVDRDEETFHLLQSIKTLVRGEEVIRELDRSPEHWNRRASHMFELLQAILAFHTEGAKLIVWAHNSHVGDADATSMAQEGQCNLGQFCKNRFGKGSYRIGMSCDQGEVIAASSWGGASEMKVIPPARSESVEHLFHQCRSSRFFLPLKGAVGDLLREKRLGRGVGVVYTPPLEYYHEASLADQYDEIIWFDQTSAIKLTQ